MPCIHSGLRMGILLPLSLKTYSNGWTCRDRPLALSRRHVSVLHGTAHGTKAAAFFLLVRGYGRYRQREELGQPLRKSTAKREKYNMAFLNFYRMASDIC